MQNKLKNCTRIIKRNFAFASRRNKACHESPSKPAKSSLMEKCSRASAWSNGQGCVDLTVHFNSPKQSHTFSLLNIATNCSDEQAFVIHATHASIKRLTSRADRQQRWFNAHMIFTKFKSMSTSIPKNFEKPIDSFCQTNLGYISQHSPKV